MQKALCVSLLAFFYLTSAKAQTVDPFELTQEYIREYGCHLDSTLRKVIYVSHRDQIKLDLEKTLINEKLNAAFPTKRKYKGIMYKLYAVLRANKKSTTGEYDHVFHIDEHDHDGWSTYNQYLRINWIKHPVEKFYIDPKDICALFYEQS